MSLLKPEPWQPASSLRFIIQPAGKPGWRSTIMRFRFGQREYLHCDHGHRTSTRAKRCAARAARKMNAKGRGRTGRY